MQIAGGVPSLLFLALILLVLPVLSLHSARQMRGIVPTPALRRAIWTSSAVNLVAILILAILAGRGIGHPFLALPPFGVKALLATIAALAACFVLRALSEAIRSEDERREMLVRLLVPQSPRDWLIWTPLVLLAGVAEEVAYRGVGMSILTDRLGNTWLAAAICAIGFAAAHALQGWKSGIIIFGIALVMHVLVGVTGTLLYAIAVHVVYDLVAGYFIGREGV